MTLIGSGTSGNPYDKYTTSEVEQELIDHDGEDMNEIDELRSDRMPLSRNIVSSTEQISSSQSYLNSSMLGEDRRAPANTIDESVWETLSRDMQAVWGKMRQVLWPRHVLVGILNREESAGHTGRLQGNVMTHGLRRIIGKWSDANPVLEGEMSKGLRDWDLWGPLIFCLLLSLLLSMTVSSEQKTTVFSGVFALVWIGEIVVTMQIKLLGGNISFFQSICIIGYTLFPLVLAALFSAVRLIKTARVPIYLILIAWSLAAGVSILGGSGVVKDRVGIAVYPLFVFYVGLGCLCFIS